ncbi:translation initiation factor IF-2 [Granulicatella adiacens ATCC 49175]|uniref:Translation initiation factor IF-2 n=1 Tax=Granulicatella adiacens ATCC 49175 TaxID=638301 RepID=C8NEU9_9LACT|nr:translation initiation factor IF-2 [Granulicatella adiacens]EEW37803.1 translation initiation factor IF-2 [Granulicatella adiacens ATCC 49175]UAK93681.1 translation initiation factor IF-2 [Granulicatella adiacens]UWP37319.1 translation initiation factor IF-2 [Granulicatella adiacens ATCC 49175]
MSKTRVYELAKELNVASKEIIEKAKEVGISYNSHMSTMEESEISKIKGAWNSKPATKPAAKEPKKEVKSAPKQEANKAEPKKEASKQEFTKKEDRAPKQGHQKQNQERNHSHNQSRHDQNDKRNQERPNQKQKNANGNRPSFKKEPARTEARSNQQGQVERPRNNQKQNNNNDRFESPKNNRNNDRRNQQRYNDFNNDGFSKKNRNQKGKKGNRREEQKAKPAVPARKFHELPEVLVYTDGMTVAELAKKIKREPAEIIKKLFLLGVMATLNQGLSKDAIELLAADYGMDAEEKIEKDISDLDVYFEEAAAESAESTVRPPVVTIMGHVDHGKTTLLDQLRNSSVVEGEAGGITQHIGAYQIKIDGKPITFLDTPGHAAFTTMRARGADITDITVIVVAADDGVMPQTIEAINHAKAADVPIIVAVNKIDKPAANPGRVMQELSDLGLVPEAWGGDTIFVEISAKFNQNIEELLEMILLVAEVQELKANPNRLALGTVIEARLDKSKGPIATLLVQEGTLKVGDPIVVGNTFGRVRVMVNDQGRRVKTALPATPVEITGLNASPQAGDRFVVFEDEKTARAAGEERAKRALIEQRNASSRITLDNLFSTLKEGELKEVNVIIKADVQGSVEALASSLQKIEVEGVRVKIIHTAVGAINESDITLATASNAIIIGFNVRPTPQAKIQAESDQVDIRLHRIIYNVIDEIETAMKGMLDPEFEEKITGQAIVRETYTVSKLGTIAGSYVLEGVVKRSSSVRLIRDNIVIYEGELASLKRFKDDAKEVKLGFECGIMIDGYNDIKVDDIIEAYEMVEIKRK